MGANHNTQKVLPTDLVLIPQSQTKVVGTLRPNAVFFPSRAPLVPVKVVYCGSVTKPYTPTLREQGDTKKAQQF